MVVSYGFWLMGYCTALCTVQWLNPMGYNHNDDTKVGYLKTIIVLCQCIKHNTAVCMGTLLVQ